MPQRIQVEFKPGDERKYTYVVPEGIETWVGCYVQIPKTGYEKGVDQYEDWVYVVAMDSDYDGPCKEILASSHVHPGQFA